MDARTQQMLSAPALPLLARMAAPSTVAFFIQGSVSLAEVWFVGQLGEISLAAIALAFPLLTSLVSNRTTPSTATSRCRVYSTASPWD